MPRIKKLTDYTYSPTNPASEDAIRGQIDDSIQEVYDASAKPSDTVNLVGNQTVAGVKTFTSSPVVPAPTTDLQASTKKYVDDGLLANKNGDHSGTWQGLLPTASEPGIQGVVDLHTVLISDLENTKVDKITHTSIKCATSSSDINPIVKTDLKRSLAYYNPSGFNWVTNPLEGHIFTDGEGTFATDFDVASLAPTGKIYYVDGILGNDSNDGLTIGTALKSIHTAGKKIDAVEILVADAYYDDSTAMNGWTIDKNLSIKAINNNVTISVNRSLVGAWTKTGGYTNVYQATRTLIKKVFDSKFLDIYGDFYQMTNVASIALVDSTQGSYYYTGSIIYVHSKDSRFPDIDIKTFLDLNNIKAASNITVYLENVKIEGGKYCVHGENIGAGKPTIYAKGCTFKYSHFDDGCGHFGSDAIYQKCVSAKNLNDGFSYNIQTDDSKAIEIDCISRNNGVDGGNDNGSTSHDGCSVIRLNSAYYQNYGPNVADVGGSHSWNMGCVSFESKGTTENSSRGFTSSTNNSLINTKMWLDSCAAYGNVYDIYADIDNFMYIRNSKYSTINENVLGY